MPRGSRTNRKPDDRFLFGTPEEVGDRNPNRSLHTTYGLPEEHPPAFVQIKPQDSTGKSINRAGLTSKSGEYKVSGGIGPGGS